MFMNQNSNNSVLNCNPYRCCPPVIPLVYDDALSYAEMLQKLINIVNQVIQSDTDFTDELQKMQEELAKMQTNLDGMDAQLEQTNDEIEKIQNGESTGMYLNSLSKWVDNNLESLVASVVKFVQFGVTDEGRFCAYIPSTWNFLHFYTVEDSSSELYGHLILSWEAPV